MQTIRRLSAALYLFLYICMCEGVMTASLCLVLVLHAGTHTLLRPTPLGCNDLVRRRRPGLGVIVRWHSHICVCVCYGIGRLQRTSVGASGGTSSV